MNTVESARETQTFLVIGIGGRCFALDAERVVEVLPMVEIVALPEWPGPLLGVVDVRSTWIAAADLGERLAGTPVERSASSYIVLLEGERATFGLLAGDIAGIHEARQSRGLIHVELETIPVLEISALLTEEERARVERHGRHHPAAQEEAA